MSLKVWSPFVRIFLAVLLAIVILSSQAHAIEYANNPGALDFTDGNNWDGGIAPSLTSHSADINGVDGITDYAFIENATVGIQRVQLGVLDGQSGGLELRNGANLSVTQTSYVGARGEGHMRILNGATAQLAGTLQIGWGDNNLAFLGRGNGTVTQEVGSIVSSTGGMVLGLLAANMSHPASVGTYNLNAGTLTLGGGVDLGPAGIGTINMAGGDFTINSFLQIGRAAGGNGSFLQADGNMIVNRSSAIDYGLVLNHATLAGGTALYEISGGSLNVTSNNLGLRNGTSGAGTGTFRIIGDAATISVESNYLQNANSALELSIGTGISPLNLGGNAALSGALNVSFTETPSFGQQFTVMNYGGSLTGSFTSFDNLVDGPGGPNSILLSIDYGTGSNSSIVLTVLEQLGDFDMMNGVNEVDFWILSDNLGAHLDGAVSYSMGDINNDGKIDLDDFGIFKDLYPLVVASALGLNVPEPTTWALMSLAVLCGCVIRSRSRKR